jgi:predicted ATPase
VIQAVAYHSLLVQQRKALHHAVGDASEALYQDPLAEHCEQLAHHFSRGEIWEKAIAYARQAGAKAAARSGHQEAVTYFEQALMALQHLSDSRETIEQAIDLRFDPRQVLFPLREFERVFTTLREAEFLTESLGD